MSEHREAKVVSAIRLDVEGPGFALPLWQDLETSECLLAQEIDEIS